MSTCDITHDRTIPRAPLTQGARRSLEHDVSRRRASCCRNPDLAATVSTPVTRKSGRHSHPLHSSIAPTGVTSLHLRGSTSACTRAPQQLWHLSLAEDRHRSPQGTHQHTVLPALGSGLPPRRRTPEVAGLACLPSRVTRLAGDCERVPSHPLCTAAGGASNTHIRVSPRPLERAQAPCGPVHGGRHCAGRNLPVGGRH